MNKPSFLLLILFLMSQLSKSQSISSFTIGKKYEYYSKVLNETRTVYIYDTVTGDTSGFYKNNLPVIYVLDGDEQFINVSTVAKYLAANEDHAPRVVVVGIWNKDRNKDFTPSYDSTSQMKNTGGAYEFGSFMEKELYPFVNNICNPGSVKIFVGHSLGGLFGVTALTRFADLFDDYVLIDPSFWWHKQQIMKELLHKVDEDNYASKLLYVSIANTLPPGADSITVRNLNPDSVSMTSVVNFIEQLKSTQTKFQWSYKYFPQENHWTVFLPSLYDGLRFVYKKHFENYNKSKR